jgi:hypothetical protein
MPERRQHVLTVEIDHSRLIRLAGVDVYDTDSTVEQIVHLLMWTVGSLPTAQDFKTSSIGVSASAFC